MTKRILAVEPKIFEFSSNEESRLRKTLEEIDSHTLHINLSSPSDIRMDDDGKLKAGGFRFTTLAMSQICQKLCPGLTKLAFTVSGLIADPDDEKDQKSVPLAVKIINDLTALRFDRISGRQLVRNTKTGLIEGMTGTGYQFLSNSEFFDRVTQAVEQSPKELVFHDARLIGRKLTVYFRNRRSILTTPGWDGKEYPDEFYEAFDLTNSETGECAMRTSPVFVLSNRDASALRGPKRRRLVHSGLSFTKNLVVALNKTINDTSVFRGLKDRIEELKSINLGFSNLSEEQHKQRISQFNNLLGQHKLTRLSADRVTRVALYRNAKKTGRPGAVFSELKKRTAYDLLISLMCESRQVSPTLKESVEKTAYELLIDRLHLPK